MKFLLVCLLLVGSSVFALENYSSVGNLPKVFKDISQPLAVTEIQWTLCETSAADFQRKINEPLPVAEDRRVYFMDTKNLDLLKSSAVLRIRENIKGKFKSSAKINYPNDQDLPLDFLAGKDANCEWDEHGDKFKVGCALDAKAKNLSQAFTQDQQDYFRLNAGFNGFQNLETLGPVQSQAWDWTDKELNLDLSLETIQGPKGLFQMEFSSRVPSKDAKDMAAKMQQWMKLRGITLCPQQQGITETLLPALVQEL